MKKSIIFLLVGAFLQTALAQDAAYKPFVEEGKAWNMRFHSYHASDQNPDYEYRYFIEGDTSIGGKSCKKLFSFNENNDNKTVYKMALYESEGKVYFIPNGSAENYVLYDFTIPVGMSALTSDAIQPNGDIEVKNNLDKVIETNGISRHCLVVNRSVTVPENYNWESGWWIEGIGSEAGPLSTWDFTGDRSHFFLSCEVNGQVVFNLSDFKSKLKENVGEAATPFFPDGTGWTEIRLDTLQHDSWYSKIDGEWVPNFETIEYYVQGDYVEKNVGTYKCVYTNGPEWTDSLTLLVLEKEYSVQASLLVDDKYEGIYALSPGNAYQFDWSIGKVLSYQDILGANATCFPPCGVYDYGIIDEIKEGDFGGVRPLKYVDLNGIRIIRGIGVTEWKDGECLFGQVNPYFALPSSEWGSRHYRSMLVHFERNGEVLYDVWPRKGSTVEVAIDGLNYFLYLDRHEAVLTSRNNCSGEVDIPSEVRYNDETFVVKSMTHTAFHNNSELTKVRIPKTIEEIIHYYPVDPDWLDPPTGMANPIYVNPFKGCTALESIEVDEENPCLKSIDGVLFSQDGVGQYYYKTGSYSGTGLYCYPEGARQESYTIPESVEWIGGAAFPNNQYLTTLTIPNSMKHICYDAFSGCSNLTDVYCYAENVPIAWDGAFRNVPIASATLHVPAGSIEEYKATSPWSGFGNIVALPIEINETTFPDEYFRNWVLAQPYGQDGVLTDEEIAGVTKINVMRREVIQSLKGIEYFTAITKLVCEMNQLTELDLSKNIKLTSLTCYGNQLTELDLSNNKELTYLACEGNELTTLDVSGFTKLKELDCQQNPMITLNVSGCSSLTTLKCYLNQLTELDVSGCAKLDTIWCEYNQLTELDVSSCTSLTFLWCEMNQLTKLDVTNNTKLRKLLANDNQLAALNLSKNKLLQYLRTYNNQIKGKTMDALIENLPIVSHCGFCPVFRNDEVDVMNAAQVAAAKSKGFIPYYWNEEAMRWMEYTGEVPPEPITFTEGQMATIILPVEPDASKGKYYRLDRVEDGKIIFEQELQPRAHVPYIIVPSEDFNIDLSTLDLEGLRSDTVSIEVTFEGQEENQSIYFIGSYVSEELEQQEGCNIQLIDTTPDCSISFSEETGKRAFLVGALRAYLTWDDPYNQGGTKGRGDMEIVLRDYGTSLASPLGEKGEGAIYDLQGRLLPDKPSKGIYIENRHKRMIKN